MDFWSELIKSIVSYGVFAMLFVFLFFYQLKDSEKREQSYRETIETLAESLQIVSDVKEELDKLIELTNENLNKLSKHIDKCKEKTE